MMKLLAALLFLAETSVGAEQAEWRLVTEDSSLTFTASYDRSPFDGMFEAFDVRFRFDPAEPASARLQVNVDVTSVDTRNADRDEALAESEWFDFANHPGASFEAVGAASGSARAFRMAGDLTIKGISRKVPIEFDWTSEGDTARAVGTARMRGDTTIDRMRFDVGTGEWADPELIGHQVEVFFDLRLQRPQGG